MLRLIKFFSLVVLSFFVFGLGFFAGNGVKDKLYRVRFIEYNCNTGKIYQYSEMIPLDIIGYSGAVLNSDFEVMVTDKCFYIGNNYFKR